MFVQHAIVSGARLPSQRTIGGRTVPSPATMEGARSLRKRQWRVHCLCSIGNGGRTVASQATTDGALSRRKQQCKVLCRFANDTGGCAAASQTTMGGALSFRKQQWIALSLRVRQRRVKGRSWLVPPECMLLHRRCNLLCKTDPWCNKTILFGHWWALWCPENANPPCS